MTRVVLLGGPGDTPNVVYHALSRDLEVVRVVLEDAISKRDLLRRRMRKLGVPTVLGQLAFVGGVVPILERRAARRAAEIDRLYQLERSPIPPERVARVTSVNDDAAVAVVQDAKPDVIVIQGTRLLSKATLSKIRVPIINMHAGITPAYRGVHGGYWALASSDRQRCGVTIHLVDAGIDTGSVLAQAVIEPTREDSFVTYPRLQLAVGVSLLPEIVRAAAEGKLAPKPIPTTDSRLWSHPTLLQYAWHRVAHGVR